jgi:hypothetical protein
MHVGHHRTSLKWQNISAEGIFEDKGQLWLLSTAGDIFSFCPEAQNPHVCNYVMFTLVGLQSIQMIWTL